MHNEDFEEKVTFLNTTLRDSIERLLVEASNKEAILAPYGRPPTPTPFVDEDEEITQGDDASNDEDDLDDATNFKYEYGFNPLVFLADYLHRAHPDSIASRQQQQSEAKARLRARVQHARNQLSTGDNLKIRAEQLRSGIIHGPLTYPLDSTSIVFFCRTVTAGRVVVELSPDSDFAVEEVALRTVLTSQGPETPLKVSLDGLEAGTKYYCRCWLVPEDGDRESKDRDSHSVEQTMTTTATATVATGGEIEDVPAYVAQCQFWTLVDSTPVSSNSNNNSNNNNNNSSDEEKHQEVELFAINGQTRQRRDGEGFGPACFEVTAEATSRPFFSIIVGDIFDNGESGAGDSEGSNGKSEGGGVLGSPSPPQPVDTQLWKLFRHDPLFFPLSETSQTNSVLCMSSMLCAWNDSQMGSDTGLKAEEIVHKQWSYDTRKFEKRQKEKLEKDKKEAFEQKGGGGGGGGGGTSTTPKKRPVVPPPALSRPAMSTAFGLLAKELPLQFAEDNVRHLYRSVSVSADVEVFVLDSRNGYLGKDQVRWLKDSIRKSSAAMKIIFSGQTFGLHFVDCALQRGGDGEEEVQTDENDVSNAVVVVEDEEEEGGEMQQIQEGTNELSVTVSENPDENTTDNTLMIDSTEGSPGNLTTQPGGGGKTPTASTTPAKKISSSRQRALEATKEEFDEDGLSKSSLAHVLVSIHRKLYSGRNHDDDDEEEEDESSQLPDSGRPESGSGSDSGQTKLELSGGILIVSSSDTEESFVASYNFGRTPEELAAEDTFCVEVGLGRARRGGTGAHPPQVCEEKAKLTASEALVTRGRTLLYRSSSPSPPSGQKQDDVNSVACSIVVKANGVLSVSLKQVDSCAVVFDAHVSSALSNE